MSAKALLLRQLAEPRRTATLVATVRHQTKLPARAERESAKEQLRTLGRFAAASAKLAAAIQVLLDASAEAEEVSLAEVWREIEQVVLRGQVAGRHGLHRRPPGASRPGGHGQSACRRPPAVRRRCSLRAG
jgi:hypothetical protein